MNIIQVYQMDPFEDGQGGGVRYLNNLIEGVEPHCESILFLGCGHKRHIKGKVEFIPIKKEVKSYVAFLLALIIRLPFMDLSKYDVLHVHRLYFAIPFILLKPRLKIVCTLHGRTFSVFASKYPSFLMKTVKPFFKFVEKFAIKNIDHLIPVSNDVIESFSKRYPDFHLTNNISIAPPMIKKSDYLMQEKLSSKEYFGLSKNYRYLGFVGRVSDVKDVKFLISLFSTYKVFFRNRSIKLVVFGNGECLSEVKKCADVEGVNDLVEFTGEISSCDIDKAMVAIEMLLISSKHESGPIVMKEALVCGTPVISNDVGEVSSYLVDNKNGFVVEKKIECFMGAIESLLKINLSREDVISFSEKKVSPAYFENVSAKYLEIYKKVVQE